MKIQGALVDILIQIESSYAEFVVEEKRQPVLYIHIVRALYGLLDSAMLFYKNLSTDLVGYGFKIDTYDPYTANKRVKGNQLTVSCHVDDLKMSHKDPVVIKQFMELISKTYGSLGKVKVN